MNKLRIEPGVMPHHSRIIINGKDISHYVCGAELVLRVGMTPQLKLNLLGNLEIPEDMDVEVLIERTNNGNRKNA